MNSKGHLYISLIKSLIRIFACGFGFIHINFALIGFLVAEILGIIEELVDKR